MQNSGAYVSSFCPKDFCIVIRIYLKVLYILSENAKRTRTTKDGENTVLFYNLLRIYIARTFSQSCQRQWVEASRQLNALWDDSLVKKELQILHFIENLQWNEKRAQGRVLRLEDSAFVMQNVAMKVSVLCSAMFRFCSF